jgi:hypothetical protein
MEYIFQGVIRSVAGSQGAVQDTALGPYKHGPQHSSCSSGSRCVGEVQCHSHSTAQHSRGCTQQTKA